MSISITPLIYITPGHRIRFFYTDWNGSISQPHVEMRGAFWGAVCDENPEPQWLLEALDLGEQRLRLFAMKDMKRVETT